MRAEQKKGQALFRARETASDLALVALALSPCFIAAILGVLWLDTQEAMLDEQAARLSQDTAQSGAEKIDKALDMLIEARAADILGLLSDGDTVALRFITTAEPQLLAVAGLHPVSGAPFPGPDAFPRTFEIQLIQSAQAVIGRSGVAWSGSALDDRPVSACLSAPPQGAVCLLIDGAMVREAVRALATDALGPSARLIEAPTRGIAGTGGSATLAPPLSGWSVIAEARIAEPRSGWALAALLAPIVSFALLIAGAIRWSWRRRQDETERHVELLAQVSHALRTPLANLRLYADLIGRKPDDGAALSRYAAVVSEETERLDALVSDALDCARAGAIASEAKPVDAAALVRSSIARIEPRIASAKGRIHLDAETVGVVVTDARALERSLDNLLDNTVRHAPGATVEVSLRRLDGMLSLRIADDGPGLPNTSAARLFRSFEQGDATGQGFGLGLAACRALTRAAGGDIAALAVERGASFELTLPIKEAARCGS